MPEPTTEAWEEALPPEMEPLLFIGGGPGSGLEIRTDTPRQDEGKRGLSVTLGDSVGKIQVVLDERETAALGAALAHTGHIPSGMEFTKAYSKALAQTPYMTAGELRLLAHQLLDIAFNQSTALAAAQKESA